MKNIIITYYKLNFAMKLYIILINFFINNKYYLDIEFLFFMYLYLFKWGLGIGDWGLGIGDWAQSPIPRSEERRVGKECRL